MHSQKIVINELKYGNLTLNMIAESRRKALITL